MRTSPQKAVLIAITFAFLLSTRECLAQNRSSYCQATFKYYNQAGEFLIYNGDDAISLGKASSGYLWAQNDDATVSMVDWGAIPPGNYKIGPYTGDKDFTPPVFGLSPMPGTDVKNRTGFVIHGIGKATDEITGKKKTAASSSIGCIILTPSQRSILQSYFTKCGKSIILTVTNKP